MVRPPPEENCVGWTASVRSHWNGASRESASCPLIDEVERIHSQMELLDPVSVPQDESPRCQEETMGRYVELQLG